MRGGRAPGPRDYPHSFSLGPTARTPNRLVPTHALTNPAPHAGHSPPPYLLEDVKGSVGQLQLSCPSVKGQSFPSLKCDSPENKPDGKSGDNRTPNQQLRSTRCCYCVLGLPSLQNYVKPEISDLPKEMMSYNPSNLPWQTRGSRTWCCKIPVVTMSRRYTVNCASRSCVIQWYKWKL
ncbi:uncharacterized protein [Symphalangus syndactylus]|uniref:uncharacterized protein isoform X2 n=1 Tax=Symphalangus syndactylus TaxID=9590 RepID=UPI0030049734